MKFDTRLKIWVGVVTAVCTLIVTSIGVWEWWKSQPKPSVDLVAMVSSGPFILPFFVEERFDELHNPKNLGTEIDKSQALLSVKDKKLREKIIVEISEHLFKYMWEWRYYILRGTLGPGQPIAIVHKYWEIRLENRGSIIAKSVKLQLPSLAYVQVRRENYKFETSYSRLIELNELQPLEKISITAWQTDLSPKDEFRLTHSEGVGRVIHQ